MMSVSVKVKPNFNIVEGYTHEIDYESFCTDFLNRMSKNDLKEKYELTESEWRTYRDRVYDEHPDAPRRTGGRLPKIKTRFTRCDDTGSYVGGTMNGNYTIWRWMNGQYRSYGTYKSKNTAEKIRSELVKYNWNRFVAYDLIKQYAMLVSKRVLLSKVMER